MKTRYRRKRRFKGIMIWLCVAIILLLFFMKEAHILLKNNDGSIDEANEGYIDSNNDISDKMSGNETYIALRAMMTQDKRIKSILDNYNDYPEELLDMLSRNIEMLDFVLDYPEMKGNVYEDTIGKIDKGSIPFLLQWDERWGYGSYGDSIVAISGCGPTCLAMVIAGLTGDNSATPYAVAQYAEENGYYVAGSGTGWGLFTEGSRYFGLQGNELPLSEVSIQNALQSGKPVICSMKPGDFTTTGHFIVLTGIEDGKLVVYDPNSKERSNELWDYQTLEYQVKNLWSFTIR